MRKQNSDFEARFISEEGSRLKNRDYFGYVELDEFACYVIADGITEITDIESARLAIETVILSFQEKPSMSKPGTFQAEYSSTRQNADNELSPFREGNGAERDTPHYP